MENLKSGFKIIIIALVITLSLTGCTKIIKILDVFVMIPPREPKLELQLENQAFEKPFTFADYSEEEYDSLFLVYPYFNTENNDYEYIRMSRRLRDLCDSNASSDSYSTLLFINNGRAEAYSTIATADAEFAAREVEKHYRFPFHQKFILDENGYVYIYEE